MARPSEPLTLYKPGEEPRRVWAIDAPAWLNLGWSLEEQTALLQPQTIPPELTAYDLRKAELEALLKQSWQKIAAIAKPLEIEKPEGGWDEAIPLILQAEFPQ